MRRAIDEPQAAIAEPRRQSGDAVRLDARAARGSSAHGRPRAAAIPSRDFERGALSIERDCQACADPQYVVLLPAAVGMSDQIENAVDDRQRVRRATGDVKLRREAL